MTIQRSRKALWMIAAAVLIPTTAAHAGVWKDVALGLNLFDIGISGERNLLGDGLTINANAFYNNREFDMGCASLTLNGILNASAGYTTRCCPKGNFSLSTGNTPLNYSFLVDTGAQNFYAEGSVLIDIDTSINMLGFYDQTMRVSNRGVYGYEGWAVNDEKSMDFDIGPIDMSGNIFLDIIAFLTEPFFIAMGQGNPFSKLSQMSAKSVQLLTESELLQARLAAGESLTDQEIATMINNAILAAFLGGRPSGDWSMALMPTAQDLEMSADAATASRFESRSVPEPAGLLLLAFGMVACLPIRRHR
ncbi:MAG: hypothetical protein GXY44_07960 [Phycisphaerales bacterium]|nr:hypothetical protein [Phycisphaerales bacterium]